MNAKIVSERLFKQIRAGSSVASLPGQYAPEAAISSQIQSYSQSYSHSYSQAFYRGKREVIHKLFTKLFTSSCLNSVRRWRLEIAPAPGNAFLACFIIILVKSILNWTNPTLKCPKLDNSKPGKTYFALNRCPEKKKLAFALVFGKYVRMKTSKHQSAIGQKITKIEHDHCGSCYYLTLSGGGVMKIWDGSPNYDPLPEGRGWEVGATLSRITLETDWKGGGFWCYHFTAPEAVELREFNAASARFWALPYRERVAAFAANRGDDPEEREEASRFRWEEREREFAPYWAKVESILALRGQKPHALIRKAMENLPADMREDLAPCVGEMASRRWPLTFPSYWSGEQAALAAIK